MLEAPASRTSRQPIGRAARWPEEHRPEVVDEIIDPAPAAARPRAGPRHADPHRPRAPRRHRLHRRRAPRRSWRRRTRRSTRPVGRRPRPPARRRPPARAARRRGWSPRRWPARVQTGAAVAAADRRHAGASTPTGTSRTSATGTARASTTWSREQPDELAAHARATRHTPVPAGRRTTSWPSASSPPSSGSSPQAAPRVVVCHRKPIMVVLAHVLGIPHDKVWRLAAAPGSLDGPRGLARRQRVGGLHQPHLSANAPPAHRSTTMWPVVSPCGVPSYAGAMSYRRETSRPRRRMPRWPPTRTPSSSTCAPAPSGATSGCPT